ncbi:hypothetical protein [Actinokineospora sp.]|uniref:hypothetical protein n=1 Tax=Actinokineospora sp. TaxID=1872133 RepID=UPI00403800C0
MRSTITTWPAPGWIVTFSMWDLRAGRARFIGIGVVAGEPEPHPILDILRLPIRALDDDSGPVPGWIARSDIIDVVPPRY